jgi:hypothetical protein
MIFNTLASQNIKGMIPEHLFEYQGVLKGNVRIIIGITISQCDISIVVGNIPGHEEFVGIGGKIVPELRF